MISNMARGGGWAGFGLTRAGHSPPRFGPGRVRVGATHRGTAQLTRPASKRVVAGHTWGGAGPGSYAFRASPAAPLPRGRCRTLAARAAFSGSSGLATQPARSPGCRSEPP
ncbi:hypothetical protein PSTG_07848 [Puccinia striiformis f. sp. tritici PST-78]|uniref:Uncharacterized protein n=1 Tax=Puccinia striiformis f. sp. tritici PST-78 TaxID=1165861 RepID=A0A0L0VHX9_9BASI|nr:hypothetical protein PSTG_07848 [Puccinia striiformis f. sp. tritici PST-78]